MAGLSHQAPPRRVDVNDDGVVSLTEFSKVAALKLHLLAQGVAELREAKLQDLPATQRRTRRSFLARIAVDRALKGLQSVKNVVSRRKGAAPSVSDVASALSSSKAKHGSAEGSEGAAIYRWRKASLTGVRHADAPQPQASAGSSAAR